MCTEECMPRKPLVYTDEFPYHIVARCNNRERFKISIDEVWKIFISELTKLNQLYGLQIHAFVLMSNHYHLIASCSKKYNLGYVMRILQTRTSRSINRLSGRMNHVYGSRYRASLIGDEFYYANALKYVYRNPVVAGLTDSVKDWDYSTVGSFLKTTNSVLPISCHLYERCIFKFEDNCLGWLDEGFSPEDYDRIKLGLTRSQFLLKKRKAPLQEFL